MSAGATEVFATDDHDEGEAFLGARRAFFPACEGRGALLVEDVGVPIPALPDLIDGIAEIARRHDTDIPVVAHAGDGNTHPNLIYDATDPAARESAPSAPSARSWNLPSVRGTITGEHGSAGQGRLLAAQLGPDVMELTRTIKDALDPQGILNPPAPSDTAPNCTLWGVFGGQPKVHNCEFSVGVRPAGARRPDSAR